MRETRVNGNPSDYTNSRGQLLTCRQHHVNQHVLAQPQLLFARSLGVLGHATNLCSAEVKHGSGNVRTHHSTHGNNSCSHFRVRRDDKSILASDDFVPTRDHRVQTS
jgi:hypothetical protein